MALGSKLANSYAECACNFLKCRQYNFKLVGEKAVENTQTPELAIKGDWAHTVKFYEGDHFLTVFRFSTHQAPYEIGSVLKKKNKMTRPQLFKSNDVVSQRIVKTLIIK